jgi:hypothetical protein
MDATSTGHVLAKGYPDGFHSFQCDIPSETQLPLWPAWAAIALKIPLILLDKRLTNIRRGHEYPPGLVHCC